MTSTQSTSPLSIPTLAAGIASAALALLSLLPWVGVLVAPLAFIAALATIVIGHLALGRGAEQRAKLGLVLGYVALTVTVAWLAVRFLPWAF